MCGRYTLRASGEELKEIFEVLHEVDWEPRFNIAPSQRNPVLRELEGERRIDRLRWGFIPVWAKDEKIGYRMINARSEEIAKSYRSALKSRRCLVIADGWYEWKNKQPFHFRLSENRPFAFAGLWERWKDIETYTIFTTTAAGLAADYHDRMPVILPPEHYDEWLSPLSNSSQLREKLLKNWDMKLDVLAANPCVGNVKNETPDCLPKEI